MCIDAQGFFTPDECWGKYIYHVFCACSTCDTTELLKGVLFVGGENVREGKNRSDIEEQER
jgi:hypothetical protein